MNESMRIPNSHRQNQSILDDELRDQIRRSLGRSNIATPHNIISPQRKHNDSSVMSLNPSAAVLCTPTTTVLEAAQLMSLTLENCVLVVNSHNELVGIFTAKDLAYRIVALGLNSSQIDVKKVMTKNPMCAQCTAPASDALKLMAVGKFRHLPVVDDHTNVVALLDITKCHRKVTQMLQNAYQHSQKLSKAISTVDSQLGSAYSADSVIKYIDTMKKLIAGPLLIQVIEEDGHCQPIYCSKNATVMDATILMKTNRTTSVLVGTKSQANGIFTSKDVVLRVVAAGLDASKCPVDQVMTPHPSIAYSNDTISHALSMMTEGKYLNLPIFDSEKNEIVGVVDAIKLTRRSLMQIQTMESITDDKYEEDDSYHHHHHYHHRYHNIDSVPKSELDMFSIRQKHVPLKSKSFVEWNTPASVKLMVLSGSYRYIYRFIINPSDGFSKLKCQILTEMDPMDRQLLDSNFNLAYLDENSDIVEIRNNSEWKIYVGLLQEKRHDRIDLYGCSISESMELTPMGVSLRQQTLTPSNVIIVTSLAVITTLFIYTNRHRYFTN